MLARPETPWEPDRSGVFPSFVCAMRRQSRLSDRYSPTRIRVDSRDPKWSAFRLFLRQARRFHEGILEVFRVEATKRGVKRSK
jgi:hypothetical protein